MRSIFLVSLILRSLLSGNIFFSLFTMMYSPICHICRLGFRIQGHLYKPTSESQTAGRLGKKYIHTHTQGPDSSRGDVLGPIQNTLFALNALWATFMIGLSQVSGKFYFFVKRKSIYVVSKHTGRSKACMRQQPPEQASIWIRQATLDLCNPILRAEIEC